MEHMFNGWLSAEHASVSLEGLPDLAMALDLKWT